MIRFVVFIIATLAISDLSAHQDTILKLEQNGDLLGLPSEYSPAKFDKEKWVISIKDNSYVFPKCISATLGELKTSEILITSSWYNPVVVVSDDEYHSFPSYLRIVVESVGFSVLLKSDTVKPFDKNSSDYEDLSEKKVCDLLN